MPDLDQIQQGEQAVLARCVCYIIPDLVERGAEALEDRIVGGCTAHRVFPCIGGRIPQLGPYANVVPWHARKISL